MNNLRLNKRYGIQFEYLLDCINSEEIGTEVSDKEKINYVFTCFEREYGNAYYKKMYPSEIVRLEQYLRCLPSCISIEFCDYNIIQIGKKWGYCKTPTSESAFADNWWRSVSLRLIQMRDILGI